jgi:GNAT superfamily N-acetyltransferase
MARLFQGAALLEALAAYAEDMEKRLYKAFTDAVAMLTGQGDLPLMMTQLRRGQINAEDLPARVKQLSLDSDDFTNIIRQVIRGSGTVTATSADLKMAWDITQPAVILSAKKIAEKGFVEINDTTMQTIQETVEHAIVEGTHRDKLWRDIRRNVGLLPSHAEAVRRYEKTLVDQGVSAGRVTKLADQYAKRLLSYRAKMISRTEVALARTTGQQLFWEQMSLRGMIPPGTKRVWLTADDERTCWICAEMDGVEVDLYQTWITPNGVECTVPPESHPQCRCAMGLVFAKGVTTTLFDDSTFSDPVTGKEAVKLVERLREERKELLSKYNPYHDELGRFTTAGNAATITDMPSSMIGSASHIAAKTRIDGGFTFNQKRKEFRRTGLAVSPFKGVEKKYSLKQWAKEGTTLVREYLKEHEEILSGPNVHVGGWVGEVGGEVSVFLDCSIVVNSQTKAAKIARENDQIAYFDLETFTEYQRKADSLYYSYGDGVFLDPQEIGKRDSTNGVYYISAKNAGNEEALKMFVEAIASSEAEIAKANPYRDELGRFTSEDKAVTIIGERSGLPVKRKGKKNLYGLAEWVANNRGGMFGAASVKLLGEKGWLGDYNPHPIPFDVNFRGDDGEISSTYNGSDLAVEFDKDYPQRVDFGPLEDYENAWRRFNNRKSVYLEEAFSTYVKKVEGYIEGITDTTIRLDGKTYEAKVNFAHQSYNQNWLDQSKAMNISLGDLEFVIQIKEAGGYGNVGEVSGRLQRKMNRAGDEWEPVFHIGMMQINEQYQKKGVTTNFLVHWQDQAAQAGVSRVDFSAASGYAMNGAYTWATLGGVPDTIGAAEGLTNGFKDYYYQNTGTKFDINPEIEEVLSTPWEENTWDDHKHSFFPAMFRHYSGGVYDFREYLLSGKGDWKGHFEPFEMQHDWLSTGEDFITLPDGNVIPLEKSSASINDVVAWWAINDPAAMERGDPKFFEEWYEASKSSISKFNPYHDEKGRFTSKDRATFVSHQDVAASSRGGEELPYQYETLQQSVPYTVSDPDVIPLNYADVFGYIYDLSQDKDMPINKKEVEAGHAAAGLVHDLFAVSLRDEEYGVDYTVDITDIEVPSHNYFYEMEPSDYGDDQPKGPPIQVHGEIRQTGSDLDEPIKRGSFHVSISSNGSAFIHYVGVAADMRGNGLGTVTFRHWEDQLHRAGFQSMALDATSEGTVLGTGMNGAYTWWSYGFTPRDYDASDVITKYIESQEEDLSITAEKGEKFLTDTYLEELGISSSGNPMKNKPWSPSMSETEQYDYDPHPVALEFAERYVEKHGPDFYPLLSTPSPSVRTFRDFLKSPNVRQKIEWFGTKSLERLPQISPSLDDEFITLPDGQVIPLDQMEVSVRTHTGSDIELIELDKSDKTTMTPELEATIGVMNRWIRENPVGLENDDPQFFKEIEEARAAASANVSKANPYHDEQGRFTTKDKAVNVSGSRTIEEKAKQRLGRAGLLEVRKILAQRMRDANAELARRISSDSVLPADSGRAIIKEEGAEKVGEMMTSQEEADYSQIAANAGHLLYPLSEDLVKVLIERKTPLADQAKNVGFASDMQQKWASSSRGESLQAAMAHVDGLTAEEAAPRVLWERNLDPVRDWLVSEERMVEEGFDVEGYWERRKEVYGLANPSYLEGMVKKNSEAALRRAFIKAQRKLAQEQLKAKGVEYVTLYRGVKNMGESVRDNYLTPDESSPLASWTTDQMTAQSFAIGSRRDAHVIEMVVPVKAIVGLSSNGWGCISEDEVIVDMSRAIGEITAYSLRENDSFDPLALYPIGSEPETEYEWVEVEKANPYHDELGRFTSKDRAATISGSGQKAKDKAFEKKYGQERPQNGTGDCHLAAWQTLEEMVAGELGEDAENIRLVQGVPYGTGGDAEGRRFDHSWVEYDVPAPELPPEIAQQYERAGLEFPAPTMVLDRSQGRNIQLPKEIYYHAGTMTEDDVRRYTYEEAHEMLDSEGHLGPWR